MSSGLSGTTEADQIQLLITEAYETVVKRIRTSIALGKLTPDNFQVMLLKVVETVEGLQQTLPAELSGIEKREIATQITEKVLEDLHAHGQIDDETYGWLKLSVSFLAPALFSGMKEIYKKLHGMVVDIHQNGCEGCVKRNCCVTQ